MINNKRISFSFFGIRYLRFLNWVLPIFCIVACNYKNENIKASTNNEALVKTYFEYFNSHNFNRMASMYADTCYFKDPSLGIGIVQQTRQQTIEKYANLVKIFPDLHDEIIHIYPTKGNEIIVEFVSTGTGPDKVKFELPICTIFTLENGFITKDFTYYDNFEEAKAN